MFRVLLLSTVASVLRVNCTTYQTTAAAMALQAMDFEVYGRVQGVFFFRKHTKSEADRLGLRGWCMNTRKGTVLGHMQGPADKVESINPSILPLTNEVAAHIGTGMAAASQTLAVLLFGNGMFRYRMKWLQTTGSPSSQIEKAEFRNRKEIPDYTFQDFGIRKD